MPRSRCSRTSWSTHSRREHDLTTCCTGCRSASRRIPRSSGSPSAAGHRPSCSTSCRAARSRRASRKHSARTLPRPCSPSAWRPPCRRPPRASPTGRRCTVTSSASGSSTPSRRAAPACCSPRRCSPRLGGQHKSGKALGLAGLTAATAGAYLGGHLALRLGAGASHAEPIDHLAALGWQDLCPRDDLPDGRPARRQLGYLSLLAIRQGDAVHVLSDHCAHLGGPLHQGSVTHVHGETCISCPWHGSVFRVSDGAVVHGPATARQPSFDSRVTYSGLVQVRPRSPRPPADAQ